MEKFFETRLWKLSGVSKLKGLGLLHWLIQWNSESRNDTNPTQTLPELEECWVSTRSPWIESLPPASQCFREQLTLSQYKNTNPRRVNIDQAKRKSRKDLQTSSAHFVIQFEIASSKQLLRVCLGTWFLRYLMRFWPKVSYHPQGSAESRVLRNLSPGNTRMRATLSDPEFHCSVNPELKLSRQFCSFHFASSSTPTHSNQKKI